MRQFMQAYSNIVRRYPFTTTAVQTGILVASGDVISQKIVEREKGLNTTRTLQYFALGTFYLGPVLTVWYRFLQRSVGTSGKYYGLKKMALDQCIAAPCGLVAFLFGISVLQGKTWENIKRVFKETYLELLLTNYTVWPVMQTINFSLVPVHLQVLFVAFVSLLWNTFLCYKTKPDK